MARRGLPAKYAKMGFKKGWKAFKASKNKRKTSSSKNKKIVRRVKSRTMAKKKRRRNGFGVQSMFKWLRLGSLVAPIVSRAMSTAATENKIKWAVADYTGFQLWDGQFHAKNLMRGWMPFIATNLMTYGVSKLNGIIRRL